MSFNKEIYEESQHPNVERILTRSDWTFDDLLDAFIFAWEIWKDCYADFNVIDGNSCRIYSNELPKDKTAARDYVCNKVYWMPECDLKERYNILMSISNYSQKRIADTLLDENKDNIDDPVKKGEKYIDKTKWKEWAFFVENQELDKVNDTLEWLEMLANKENSFNKVYDFAENRGVRNYLMYFWKKGWNPKN